MKMAFLEMRYYSEALRRRIAFNVLLPEIPKKDKGGVFRMLNHIRLSIFSTGCQAIVPIGFAKVVLSFMPKNMELRLLCRLLNEAGIPTRNTEKNILRS